MKKLSLLFLLLFSFTAYSQLKPKKTVSNTPKNSATNPKKEKKYPSLLWEISGNGLKKPSYLFGTMHISNKLAFHLGDSFYNALKSVDVVALEQDPNLWQEEYSKMTFNSGYSYNMARFGYADRPGDRLSINTFSIKGYEERLKASFPLEARMVNGMMYRTDPSMEDFEEDTYLDMYIYQSGKRLNKIVTGVENFKETEKLVKKAYKALMKERYSKRKSYNYKENVFGWKKSEEAYRNGDLDLIDSIEMAGIISQEYQEYFMYKRNEIQVNSIDTILKKHSLFVGVGAAHLPGSKGVIELLRKKGYTVRPIMMGERNSEEKDKLEKTRVAVSFKEQWMEDSSFSVKIPGSKLYRYPVFNGIDMQQYADMANGSYYMVSRLRTNAAMLGQGQDVVMKKIDSLLYENIPGKIISKKLLNQQGVKGYEIINKTRKGDGQHYHIYVLADEIIILKASGVGDYILQGDEAETFLSSIKFNKNTPAQAVEYKPPYGGFVAKFPVTPSYISEERNAKHRQEWTANDGNGNSYLIFKTNLHHYDYIEEDTFDLSLAEESFSNSSFIGKKLKREQSTWNKYPSLLSEYKHNDGSTVKAMFIVQGNNYYVLATKSQKPATLLPFFESFRFMPYEYPEVKDRADSLIGFKVKSPVWYPPVDEDQDDIAEMYSYMKEEEESADYYMDYMDQYKSAVFTNDTTGEHIMLQRYVLPEYSYWEDSSKYFKYYFSDNNPDSEFIYRSKEVMGKNNWRVLEYQLTDTASSRLIMGKNFYKKGVNFRLIHMTDTLTPRSSFIENFFNTFEPVDTLKFRDPFTKKSEKYFADYFSTDTVLQKKARNHISSDIFDSSDLSSIKKVISQLNWDTKKYLDTKRKWIDILGSFKDSATANYLADLYVQVKDTSDLQNDILDALVSMRTKYSYNTFKKLVLNDPPALVDGGGNNYDYGYTSTRTVSVDYTSSYEMDYASPYSNRGYGKWGALYDTLQLTSGILPELVDLMILEDYSPIVVQLLVTAVDSGYLKPDQYKQFYNRFLLEAKQLSKKQFATEAKKEIDKASTEKEKKEDADEYKEEEKDYGNDKLVDYAVLLMPFYDNAEVRSFFDKLLTTKDKKLQFDIVLLMLRNKKSIHDTLIAAIATQDDYRLRLYNDLDRGKLLEKFPAQSKKQEDFARSILKKEGYNKPDSLVFLQKEMITYKGEKGWLYFYKFKQMKDDPTWKIAVSGMQPFDQDKIATKFESWDRQFIDYTEEEFIDKQSLANQVNKIIKELKYAKRSSSRGFYEDKDSDLYETVLSDRVKENRYD